MQPPPMTKQQIFDTVAKHLLTQKRKSIAPTGCAYFGPDNTRCAIGILMLEHPNKYNTGWGVANLMNTCPSLLPPISNLAPRAWKDFFQNLQHIHDSCEPEGWRDALRLFARNRRLSTAVLRS